MAIKEAKVMAGRSPLAVTAEEFVFFLQTKTSESVCPACGTDDWTVVCPPEDEPSAFRLMTPLLDGPRSAALHSFAIYCDNCGYLRQHLARVVKAWANDNQMELDLVQSEEPGDD